MSDFKISTLRSVYITNQPYQYPMPWLQSSSTPKESAGSFFPCINTGWHIIPNLLWGHLCSPKQWWEMVIKYEAIKVNAIHCRLFNPIPIQTAVSFQGTSTFPAFNNTVYALAYADNIYETPWFDWWAKPYISDNKQIDLFYEFNPAWKEGTIQQPRDGTAYPYVNEAVDQRKDYDADFNVPNYPKQWTTKTYQAATNNMLQTNKYRRQFLPIYWYHNPFKQYHNLGNAAVSWLELNTDFEYAYNDVSGAFWDPLNRPDDLMELRPGKNMIEFSWKVHEADSGIWFNTDRIASIQPYGRPRPTDLNPGIWNMPMKPRMIDPRGPGNSTSRYQYLKTFGILKQGDPVTVPKVQMAPETQMSIPSWRRWPVVPSGWFYKELQQSNPWVYQQMTNRIYAKNSAACPQMTDSNTTAGDVEVTGCMQDIKFPGTEYEQHKYPPDQWFIKAVPLFDNAENRIQVEMQMFMHITVSLAGKPRSSALYAPSWGPVFPMDLYSVNMDTNFGENYIRTRSGGARRTWYDPSDGPPEMVYNPQSSTVGQIYPDDTTGFGQNQIPYGVKHVCDVSTEAVQPSQRPFGGKYSTQKTPPSNMRVTVRDDGDRDFEVIDEESE